ncbi:binding-protein-dependent transport systems inner membrane component [Rhodoferax ferrireducens T118]|uniref:Binding-protein-dependent transport systems inner membrane component n=1 Tax=Albidiferax ferrireducens (strain ATCC BAA-621 / DSM 15236 / T118) TaxID=338969 RepID=Q21ZS5_ALBFT|nr:ABC transporter permease [Rhodoferax ferrireducens]ABD68728.1 binding-protein-dependent transport systems inner membrane component [Rhodoferax ferrireducens T118]WPC67953.1 ABC transporter permease [Rhodoferax ferrireducens]
MPQYLLRRFIAAIPVMFLVSLMSFAVIWLVPGDPASSFLDASATQEQIARIRQELGLNQPLWQQMLHWYGRVLTGDLGQSILLHRSVGEALLERLPVTLSLAALALVLAAVLGISAGIFAAMHRGGIADRTVMTASLLGLSVPDFWLGLVMIVVFAVGLGWLPSGGFVPITESVVGWMRTMTLPALTLALVQTGFIARMTRSAMLDVLHQDFIRTADAKGLKHGFVVLRHGLPNAMLPILTVLGIIAGSLLGGAVVVEQVFSLPGVGRLIIGAIMSRDFPVIQGGLLFLAAIYVVINLMVDLLYAVVDPRVRL